MFERCGYLTALKRQINDSANRVGRRLCDPPAGGPGGPGGWAATKCRCRRRLLSLGTVLPEKAQHWEIKWAGIKGELGLHAGLVSPAGCSQQLPPHVGLCAGLPSCFCRALCLSLITSMFWECPDLLLALEYCTLIPPRRVHKAAINANSLQRLGQRLEWLMAISAAFKSMLRLGYTSCSISMCFLACVSMPRGVCSAAVGATKNNFSDCGYRPAGHRDALIGPNLKSFGLPGGRIHLQRWCLVCCLMLQVIDYSCALPAGLW